MTDTHSWSDLSEVDGSLSRDEVFDLLSERRRRYVVASLDETAGSVGVSDLALQIAQWESDQSSEPDSDPESLSYLLHHAHLPKLDDAAVVDYDPDDTEVEPGPNFDPMRELVTAEISIDSN